MPQRWYTFLPEYGRYKKRLAAGEWHIGQRSLWQNDITLSNPHCSKHPCLKLFHMCTPAFEGLVGQDVTSKTCVFEPKSPFVWLPFCFAQVPENEDLCGVCSSSRQRSGETPKETRRSWFPTLTTAFASPIARPTAR